MIAGVFDIPVECPARPPETPADQLRLITDALSFGVRRDLAEVIGLERRLAHDLRIAALARGYQKSSQSRFADRPASEPVLGRLWPALMGPARAGDVDELLTGLLGQPAVRRRHRSTTRYANDGTRSVFPPAAQARGWLSRIDRAERAGADPFAQACFAYAQTVLSHPYCDGNGRLARAMYQRSLGRSELLWGPLLPLGPLVYANHRVHDRALQHLGATGDWSPFVDVMAGLTRKAAAFTRDRLSKDLAKTAGGVRSLEQSAKAPQGRADFIGR